MSGKFGGSVRVLLRALILGVGLLAVSARVEAYPLLQLDIVAGTYDPVTQTTIAGGPDFTLIALLTPKATDNLAALLGDTYYISAALMPKVGPAHSDVGSFSWNGTHFNATGDMTFGTPPMEGIDANFDAGDLNDPNIFPTFFKEFAFQFSPELRALPKYVPVDAGGVTPTSATGNVTYYQMFNVTTLLRGDHVLHFNLYDTYIKRCARDGTCAMDIDIEHAAPLYADAESVNSVPEPTGAALLSLGLLFAVRRLRGVRVV
jgi:hypothetical protein